MSISTTTRTNFVDNNQKAHLRAGHELMTGKAAVAKTPGNGTTVEMV
jgi:hypothetical protein